MTYDKAELYGEFPFSITLELAESLKQIMRHSGRPSRADYVDMELYEVEVAQYERAKMLLQGLAQAYPDRFPVGAL